MKAPTANQAAKLRILADGYFAATPRRGEWVGLLRVGWVERIDLSSPRGGVLPPLRITADGLRALATTEPEEGACTPTTSVRTSRRPAASTSRSRSAPSSFSGSISPRPEPAPRKSSCASSAPPLPSERIALVTSSMPPVSDIQSEVDLMARDLEIRRDRRHRDWTANITFRCPSCKLFVRNPKARCQCGYDADIGWAA